MKKIKIWYDSEGDFLEVMFENKEGYFKETASDQVMEKVDMDGKVIGFSILNRLLKNYFYAFFCHSRENGNPFFLINYWIPAFAGMTISYAETDFFNSLSRSAL